MRRRSARRPARPPFSTTGRPGATRRSSPTRPGASAPRVLVLTPVKDAVPFLDRHFELLHRLDYPKRRLSLGFLESDSADGTHDALAARLPVLRRRFRRVGLWKKDFGFRLPPG